MASAIEQLRAAQEPTLARLEDEARLMAEELLAPLHRELEFRRAHGLVVADRADARLAQLAEVRRFWEAEANGAAARLARARKRLREAAPEAP